MTGGIVPASNLRWVWMAAVTLLAGWLGAVSLRVNLDRACEQQEWPVLSSCETPGPQASDQVRALRERITANPGDSAGWLALALLTQQPGGVAPLNEEAVLDMAVRVAGEDVTLQRLLASRALEREQWPEAVKWLVRLVEDQNDAGAAQTLATLTAQPAALAAMRAALKADSRWLLPVLAQTQRAQVLQAMPLVADALRLRLVPPATGQALMRNLKADGRWFDAHALWVYLVGGPVPLLFNGQFEQGFIADGFDWEVANTPPSLAGVQVFQPTLGARGRVLQLEFSGKRIAQPMARQIMVLLDGDYVLTGDYMARRMRTEQGLVWLINCANDGRELARTPPLLDTQGVWKKLQLPFTVPAGCGNAVVLQLRTSLGSEALAGMRGQMHFDNFSVVTGPVTPP